MTSKLLAVLEMWVVWGIKVKMFPEMPPLKNDINCNSV